MYVGIHNAVGHKMKIIKHTITCINKLLSTYDTASIPHKGSIKTYLAKPHSYAQNIIIAQYRKMFIVYFILTKTPLV